MEYVESSRIRGKTPFTAGSPPILREAQAILNGHGWAVPEDAAWEVPAPDLCSGKDTGAVFIIFTELPEIRDQVIYLRAGGSTRVLLDKSLTVITARQNSVRLSIGVETTLLGPGRSKVLRPPGEVGLSAADGHPAIIQMVSTRCE